jgi:hypothetical protein
MCLRRSLVVISGSSMAALRRGALFVSGGALSLLLSGFAVAQSPGIRAPSSDPPKSHVTIGQMLAQIPDAPGDEGVGPPDEEPPMTDIWPAPAVVPKKKDATAAEIVHLMHKAMAKPPTQASVRTSTGASRGRTHGHSQRTPTPSIVSPPAGE